MSGHERMLDSPAGFRCPQCGGITSVMDSRPLKVKIGIRRRRHCVPCDLRFTTRELVYVVGPRGEDPRGKRIRETLKDLMAQMRGYVPDLDWDDD